MPRHLDHARLRHAASLGVPRRRGSRRRRRGRGRGGVRAEGIVRGGVCEDAKKRNERAGSRGVEAVAHVRAEGVKNTSKESKSRTRGFRRGGAGAEGRAGPGPGPGAGTRAGRGIAARRRCLVLAGHHPDELRGEEHRAGVTHRRGRRELDDIPVVVVVVVGARSPWVGGSGRRALGFAARHDSAQERVGEGLRHGVHRALALLGTPLGTLRGGGHGLGEGSSRGGDPALRRGGDERVHLLRHVLLCRIHRIHRIVGGARGRGAGRDGGARMGLARAHRGGGSGGGGFRATVEADARGAAGRHGRRANQLRGGRRRAGG